MKCLNFVLIWILKQEFLFTFFNAAKVHGMYAVELTTTVNPGIQAIHCNQESHCGKS